MRLKKAHDVAVNFLRKGADLKSGSSENGNCCCGFEP